MCVEFAERAKETAQMCQPDPAHELTRKEARVALEKDPSARDVHDLLAIEAGRQLERGLAFARGNLNIIPLR